MTSASDWPCVALPRAELADRTTLRVGGEVEWLLEPANPGELQEAWKIAVERGWRPRLLGGGANLIVEDGLLPGVVIATERMRLLFRPLDVAAAGEEGQSPLDSAAPPARVAPADPAADPRLVVWAGCTLPTVLRAARDLGYSGLEGLVGVPGHLGGGLAMNAGGRWGEIWDVVVSVRVLEADGSFADLERGTCSPGYRDGGLGGRAVVGAVLAFEPRPKQEVVESMREHLLAKNRVQPVSLCTAGCIFKNPDPELSGGRSAGRLIEECGGKGLSRGRAVVSELHANFIVNRGGASAADVLALIEEVADLVAHKTGIRLEMEVEVWRSR